jgi:hypothetical protein
MVCTRTPTVVVVLLPLPGCCSPVMNQPCANRDFGEADLKGRVAIAQTIFGLLCILFEKHAGTLFCQSVSLQLS